MRSTNYARQSVVVAVADPCPKAFVSGLFEQLTLERQVITDTLSPTPEYVT